MADETTDESQKTEDPTQKRLDDAHQKGQMATSREVNNWFMILAATLLVAMILPDTMRDLGYALRFFVEKPHLIPLDDGQLWVLVRQTLFEVGAAMLMPIVILLTAAVLSGIVQTGIVFAPDRIQPKLEKISLFKGIKRMFSLKSIAEFVKGLLKITIVATVATMLLLPEFDDLPRYTGIEMPQLLATLSSLIVKLLLGVLAVITVIAGLDFLYQKFEHLKQMRMSHQEIRDELKQTDGDPIVKQRLRQIRHDRARRRMMAAVPEAAVVITNPTHYAVALKYDMDSMAAPILIAKGVDQIALNIRKVAADHGIPIVQNPIIARALHAGVELDEEVPPEHYKAVAEIIGYVFRLKGKLPART